MSQETLNPSHTDRTQTSRITASRVATTAMFFTNGFAVASLAPRYPEIKADLALSNTIYGLAIAAAPAGALAFGWAAGKAVRRFGDAQVATAGTILMACSAWLAALAPQLIAFAVPLFIFGALDAIVDVAQNSHGLRVQRIAQRTLINSFHAFWSLGVVAGGLGASLMIALGVSRSLHLAVTGTLLTVVIVLTFRLRLPQLLGTITDTPVDGAPSTPPTVLMESRGRHNTPTKIWLILAGLSAVGIAACLIEDLGPSWSTEYLAGILSASAAIAPLGYVALMGAEFIGRLTGDRLVDLLGQHTVVLSGALLAIIGLLLAIAVPTIPTTLIGFALAGFGVATLGPLAMEAADNLPHLPPGTGLTITSWILRFGFLMSPPLVGMIADATTLRVGLLVYPCAGLVVVMLAGLFAQRNPKIQ